MANPISGEGARARAEQIARRIYQLAGGENAQIQPGYHVWTSHKPRWAVIDDRLPAFEATRQKR
jgi:hypothetical protein